MDKIEMIKKIAEKNRGIVTVKELEKQGIHRQYVKQLVDEGYLDKLYKGVYMAIEIANINDFYVLGQEYKSGIFSHNSALYIYGLTDRTPLVLDMTFPSNIRLSSYFVTPHYINKERFEIGETTKTLEDGTPIRIYNMERTICDIIRDRNKTDTQILNTAMKEYMKRSDKNLNLLYEYAKIFKITKILKMYLEVLA